VDTEQRLAFPDGVSGVCLLLFGVHPLGCLFSAADGFQLSSRISTAFNATYGGFDMDLKLPNLGEGADSGTVVNLFVKEGDQVIKDQPILELENEKAIATIPSTAAGRISQIFVKPGDKLSVGQRILSLSETGERAAEKPAAVKPEVIKSRATQAEPSKPASEQRPDEDTEPDGARTREQPDEVTDEGQPSPAPSSAGVAASPSIRKMAADLGLDLTRVRGSERGGRIVLADVRAYIQTLQRAAAQPKQAPGTPSAQAQPAAAKHEPIDFSKWGPVSKKPFSPLRQVIARRMTENWNTIPHVTQFDETDVTALMALRSKHAKSYEQKGARLTLTAFALKVVVDTLKKHPAFNSSLDEAAQELVTKEYFHIGVAVDTEAGLIVPVIRDVDKKSVFDLARELEELAKKARERKVTGEELKGGSFTISNQGGIGGAHFTPIINKPEVAILGLGRGQMKAVVRGEKVEPRMMLPLAVSYDHRVIDGAVAARFVVDLVRGFEGVEESIFRI
jgi:pyruvate dehydrogenase E2 component (dihydrolipoamide acetyltransferase)